MQNGELNPCCKREKLKEVLLGHQPYRMAKALGDYSMVEKHETSEHARQGNRVKKSCGNKACQEIVVPGGDFAPKA